MTGEDIVVRLFRIRGRVQGVGFRAFVWRSAAELGIRGWVRNCRDGTVEVLAGASPSRLAFLEELLRQGSGWARVDGVDVTEEPAEELPAGFSVVYDR